MTEGTEVEFIVTDLLRMVGATVNAEAYNGRQGGEQMAIFHAVADRL